MGFRREGQPERAEGSSTRRFTLAMAAALALLFAAGPHSRLEAQTQVCGNGVVEGTEQCDEGASNCPGLTGCSTGCCNSQCQWADQGDVCRPAAGVCDVAETCNGSTSTCPSDSFMTSGECRPAVSGACDVAESCDGSGPDCPADANPSCTPDVSPSPTPSGPAVNTATETPTVADTATATETATITATPTITKTPTDSPTATLTPTPKRCCQCASTNTCGGPPPPADCLSMGCTLIDNAICQGALGHCATIPPTPTITQTLTPTITRTSTPTITPTPTLGGFAVGPYKCYRARTAKNAPKFPTVAPDGSVTIVDDYGSKDAKVLNPVIVCNPATDGNGDVPNPNDYLTCYKIHDSRPHFEKNDVIIRNEFGEVQNITMLAPDMFCVPSRKYPTPTPRP